MPAIEKPRKWQFLLLGAMLILVSAFLWYWDWRSLGLPSPLRVEHYITILTYVLGVVVLAVFVYRLNRKQLTVMLVGMIVVNLLAVLMTTWIYRTYPALFELLRHKSIETYDPTYVAEWETCFIAPALFSMHAGLVALLIESLVMFLVRKPTDNPE